MFVEYFTTALNVHNQPIIIMDQNYRFYNNSIWYLQAVREAALNVSAKAQKTA